MKLKVDIIVECFTAPISTLCSPLFTKVPVVALPSMFNASAFTKKYHLPFHLVEKFGLRLYKYIMPYSDVDCAKAKRHNKNIICRVIPQGVGKEYFQIKHQKPKHILFLGRLDIAQKGIDLLLQAYAKVKDEIGYPLILAGHGPDEGKINKYIQKMRLQNSVKIVGPAYGKKKLDLISHALFVAFPSRHDEMSLWALEALASGVPLVSFNLSECKWVNNKICLKAKPFDVKEYSGLLIKAASVNNRNYLSNECRKVAKMFTWSKVAHEFEKFFKQIIYWENAALRIQNHSSFVFTNS